MCGRCGWAGFWRGGSGDCRGGRLDVFSTCTGVVRHVPRVVTRYSDRQCLCVRLCARMHNIICCQAVCRCEKFTQLQNIVHPFGPLADTPGISPYLPAILPQLTCESGTPGSPIKLRQKTEYLENREMTPKYYKLQPRTGQPEKKTFYAYFGKRMLARA